MKSDDLTTVAVERLASAEPDRIAVQDTGGVEVTYGALHTNALRWAHALEAAGGREGDRIALMLATTACAFTVQLAIGWLGATVVALNPLLRGRLLSRALACTGCTVLVTDAEHWAQVAPVADLVPALRSVVITDADGASLQAGAAGRDSLPVLRASDLLSGAETRPRRHPGLADIQGIIFTSGTTGPSKPVMLSHEFVLTCARRLIPGVADAAGGAYYSPWSVGHSLGSLALAAAVDRGVRLVLRDRFTASRFWDDVRSFDCRTTVLVSVAPGLWDAPRRGDDADNPLQYAAMTPLIREYRAFSERFAVKVSALYGATEIGPVLLASDPAHHGVSGRPAPDYECRLVDAHGAVVPDGTPGELVVRSLNPRGLMSGYADPSAATSNVLSDGWLRTGDLFVREPSGDFCFQDRLKDSIRRRGRSISSYEIEAEAATHPDVVLSAAVGVPADQTSDTPHAEEDVKLFIVPRPGSDLTAPQVIDFLATRLPRFMVPRYVEFCDGLPVTPDTGRPVKSSLRERPNSADTYDRQASRPASPAAP
jgi:crotonobetaine/carnitine-CoA ligase